jgi:tetratricopeptide (TPR) repeat protein
MIRYWGARSNMLEPFGKAALGQLLSALSTHAREWFKKTPLELAAMRIVSTHRHGEAFNGSLEAWFNSPAFKTALFGIQRGDSESDKSALASALIDSGFAAGHETPTSALEIVTAFFEVLEQELLKSDEGMLFGHNLHAKELRQLSADQRAGTRLLQTGLETISRNVSATQAILEDTHGTTDELNRRIDAARDQLRAGKISTARDLLLGVQKDTRNRPLPLDIQHRIFTNLGVCELHLLNSTEAADLFETAYRLRPDDPKAKANRAVALRLRGDHAGARQFAEEAQASSPENPSVLSVLSDLLERAGERPKAIELIEQSGTANEGLRERLAELYVREGQVERALELLGGTDGGGSTTIMLRGEAEVRRAAEYSKRENPLPGHLPEVAREGLKSVERDLGRVVDRGRAEWPALYIAARTLRGYARAFLLRHGDACEDLGAVSNEENVDPNVLVNLAAFRLVNNQPSEALTAAEHALRLRPDDLQTRLLVADVAAAKGDWARSLTAAREATMTAACGHDLERANAAVAEALRGLKRLDEAQDVLDRALVDSPDSHELLSMRASFMHDRGDTDGAIACAENAIERASGPHKYLAMVRAGDLAFRAKRYEDAVRFYRAIVKPEIVTESLSRFVISLYEIRAFDEALSIARQARGDKGPVERISEVEGAILERFGQLQEAASLYEKMVAAGVAPVRALERWAAIDYRQGRTDAAMATVAKLVPRASHDPHALMMCAHLLVAVSRITEALPLAYRALGLAQDRPDLYLAYVGVVNAIPEEQVADFFPDVVGIDTAVSIEIAADSATYVILEASEPRLWRDEVSATSEIAGILLGHRAGDRVALPSGPLGPRSAIVRAVRNKYVARFQVVVTEFNRQFPESTGMWKLSSENAVTDAKTLMDAQERRIATAMDAYHQRQVPVGLLAKMVGRSSLETWRTLIGTPDYRPFVQPGDHRSLVAASEALRARRGIVLDLSASVTLSALEALENVGHYQASVFVPQSVIDAISEEIDERRVLGGGRPMLITYKKGDVYYREEITSEQIRGAVERLEKMREQLRRYVVVGCPSNSPV